MKTQARRTQDRINKITAEYKSHYPKLVAGRKSYLDGKMSREVFLPIRQRAQKFLNILERLDAKLVKLTGQEM